MDAVKTFKKEAKEIFVKIQGEDIEKLHNVQLKILKDFVSFCDAKNLTYYLTGGSALGAVRHGGFIPWDDDIDIAMPRDDYNKLRDTFPKEQKDKYFVEAPGLEHCGSSQFMKIRKRGTVLRGLMNAGPEYGIFIDVFPLDYAPDSRLMKYFYQALYFVKKSLPYSVIFYNLYDNVFRPHEHICSKRLLRSMHIKRGLGHLLSAIPASKWLLDFDKSTQKKPSPYYVVPSGIHTYMQECFPVDVFYPPRKMKFEDMEVSVPNKVEILLTRFYGDYMQMPTSIPESIDTYLAFDLGEIAK